MKKEFRSGLLAVYDFDQDDEIEIEIEDYDSTSSVYLSRTKAVELRNWLTEQIKSLK